jgi:superoxide dismutase
VAAFFNIINWDAVNEFYEMATSKGQGGSCD